MGLKLLKKGILKEEDLLKSRLLTKENEKLSEEMKLLLKEERKWSKEKLLDENFPKKKKELQKKKELLRVEIQELDKERTLLKEKEKKIGKKLSSLNDKGFLKEEELLKERKATRSGLLLMKRELLTKEQLREQGFLRKNEFVKEWGVLKKRDQLKYFKEAEIKEFISIIEKIEAYEQKLKASGKRILTINQKINGNNQRISTINRKIKHFKQPINPTLRGKINAVQRKLIINEDRLQKTKLMLSKVEIKIKNQVYNIRLLPQSGDSLMKVANTQFTEPYLMSKNLDPDIFYSDNIDISEILPEEGVKLGYWYVDQYSYKKSRSKLIELQEKNTDLNIIEVAKNTLGTRIIEKALEEAKSLPNFPNIFEECSFYFYKGNLYYFNGFDIYTQKEQELLVKEHYFKQEKKFKRLQKEIQLFEKLESSELPQSREPIPEDVRFFVWRRDGGKCAKCGSKENLEFDHIIPVSKGGSSTERNIQLLCEKCNREKSNKI